MFSVMPPLVTVAFLIVLGMAGMAAFQRLGPRRAGAIVYVGCIAGSLANVVFALAFLLKEMPAAAAPTAVLPIGVPFLGTHLRLDGLSAIFLLLVNGLGALAALFGYGYGRHEEEPQRVLPFFPVFLAGMNLVLLAD